MRKNSLGYTKDEMNKLHHFGEITGDMALNDAFGADEVPFVWFSWKGQTIFNPWREPDSMEKRGKQLTPQQAVKFYGKEQVKYWCDIAWKHMRLYPSFVGLMQEYEPLEEICEKGWF